MPASSSSSFRNLLATLPLLLLAACASPRSSGGNPESPYPPSRPPVIGDILHIPTGFYVTEAQMLAVATDARIVYVGETHDNPASHRLELTLLKVMAERYPGSVALGMEMFTPAQQEALDRWVNGNLTEKEFIKESGWQERWQMDFDYYRPLLDFAREHRIPVIGLNAPKSLVKSLARKDVDSLGEEERRMLPEMAMDDPYHAALVAAIYGGHDKGNSHLAGFRRVQTLWDETMAENIVRYLESQKSETRRMVVVAGGNHVQYGFGIPRRVFRRLPVSYTLVGSKELVIAKGKEDRVMNVDIPGFPMPPYDFLVFTEYEDLPHRGVKLGVMMEEVAGRIRIKGILPGSAAESAGLREGDILLAIDGVALKENFDLIHALKQKKGGEHLTLQIERDGAEQSIKVSFPEPAVVSSPDDPMRK